MIIEIKDLPEGRKVSRILVDISFEDSGAQESLESIDTSKHTKDDLNSNTIETKEVDIKSPEVPVVDPASITIEDRPVKDVPDEMLNIEF